MRSTPRAARPTWTPPAVEATHGPGFLARRFPSITAALAKLGHDLAAAPVPVTEAAHYWMGGVFTDRLGRTTLPGLYAAGETACTGVHGANRLASNSLLEALVFAWSAVVNLPGRRRPPNNGIADTGYRIATHVLTAEPPDRS